MSGTSFPRSTLLLSPDDKVADVGRLANNQSLNTILDASYWRSICPDLHVGGSTFQKTCTSLRRKTADLRKQIDAEGVAQVVMLIYLFKFKTQNVLLLLFFNAPPIHPRLECNVMQRLLGALLNDVVPIET